MVIDATQMVDTERGLLDRRIFSSQEIYQEEQEKVFGRAWLFIGHESLVPNPHDFMLTYMGEDPVILTRDGQGGLHAFLNMCRHRGNRVARADDGNAKNFMCTYHGWTYSSEGKLVSVPGLQEAYYGELDVDKLGLVSVAKLDTYAGSVFATWDPEAPSLEDYLGDMRWYMDMMFNRRDGGVQLIGPFKWMGHFNWKLAIDNFSGDNYHVPVTHRGAMIAMAKVNRREPQPADAFIRDAGSGNGVNINNMHGVSGRWGDSDEDYWRRSDQQDAMNPVMTKYQREVNAELERRLGFVRARRYLPTVGTVFPTHSFLFLNGTVRMWVPHGPLETEIWAYVAVDQDAPQEVKDVRRRHSMSTFGPSGIFEQDDMDNWRQSTEAGKTLMGRNYPSLVNMANGYAQENEVYPGKMVMSHLSEETQRAIYAGWQSFMTAKSWKDIPVAGNTPGFQEGTATFKG